MYAYVKQLLGSGSVIGSFDEALGHKIFYVFGPARSVSAVLNKASRVPVVGFFESRRRIGRDHEQRAHRVNVREWWHQLGKLDGSDSNGPYVSLQLTRVTDSLGREVTYLAVVLVL